MQAILRLDIAGQPRGWITAQEAVSAYAKGDVISGLDADQASNDLKIFHAGTAEQNGDAVTAGGRVLCAVALGDNVADAQAKAYELVDEINWNNVYCRRDIGYRAVARERG